MTRDELIQAINDLADEAVKKFNKNIPGIQRETLAAVQNLLKDLDYDNGKIVVTVKNMRAIGGITSKLRRLILTGEYEKSVTDFIKSFSQITTLQNQYLRQTFSDFKLSPILTELKDQSIAATIASLTEQGLEANFMDPIKNVLRTNITTGGNFTSLLGQMRGLISTTPEGTGVLDRFAKRITNDSLNQYSRNYLQLASQGINFEWYQYTGSNILTTRCFCHAMTQKRFFHITEIPKLIKGDFKEFQERGCILADSTDLPEGMIPGTNVSNFLVNLGGYNCGHRAIPVLSSYVPKEIRDSFKS